MMGDRRMPVWVMFLFDLLLALGAALRLTRFVVADSVPGDWWIKWPLENRVERLPPVRKHRVERYLEGLSCPYCVGVWMSAFVVGTLALAGGPSDAAGWWRYPAGFLALAWIVGHVAARVGDTSDEVH